MNTLQSKKVSVIVPNYNYAKFIKKRLKTILGQTYPIYELIILDDCSTDGSVEIIKQELEKIKAKFSNLRVIFVRNNKNSGKSMAQWKKGFELAKGDFVWIAEADDLSNRRFLEETMKGFDDPKVVLSYAESSIINEFGIMIAPNFRWSRDKEKTGHFKTGYKKDGKQEIEEIMAIRCTIPNVSGVVFRNDKKWLKYLDEALKFSQVGDWYFYTKVLENGKISYNRRSLNKFRVHRGSVTNKSKSGRQHYAEVVKMHEYFNKNFDIKTKIKIAMDNELMRVRARHGIIK